MGRKKGNTPSAKEDARPFCFYCDRKFDDEQTLLQHQRAKHFRCPECDHGAIPGKCESVQGLIVHTLKLHAKALARVPNAMQGRDSPDLNVYGMEGVPVEMLREKGYARDEVVAVIKESVAFGPPASQPQEAFSPSALLALPAFGGAPEGAPSMLGAPGLPAPPGAALSSMLGMPGLPAPPGMPDVVPRPAGLPDPKAGAAGMTSMAGLPGLPMPGMPGMPALLAGLPPFPDVRREQGRGAWDQGPGDAHRDQGLRGAEAGGRGAKRPLDEKADQSETRPIVHEDVSVEELRAQLARYQPSSWARGAGS